jgi:hypothetical protein
MSTSDHSNCIPQNDAFNDRRRIFQRTDIKSVQSKNKIKTLNLTLHKFRTASKGIKKADIYYLPWENKTQNKCFLPIACNHNHQRVLMFIEET